MEDLLREIISIDAVLRQKVADTEAQLKKLKNEDAAIERGQTPEQQGAQRQADEILEAAARETQRQTEALQARYEQAQRSLRQAYEEHRAAWTQEVVRRCVSLQEDV